MRMGAARESGYGSHCVNFEAQCLNACDQPWLYAVSLSAFFPQGRGREALLPRATDAKNSVNLTPLGGGQYYKSYNEIHALSILV